MNFEELSQFVNKRIVNSPREEIDWEINFSKSIINIKIESTTRIIINQLTIDFDDTCSFEVYGSEASKGDPKNIISNGEYIQKWNNENYYFIEIKFEKEIFINKVYIKTFNPSINSDDYKSREWIYNSKVTPRNSKEFLPAITFDDGVDWNSLKTFSNDIKILFKNASYRQNPKDTFSIYKKIKRTFDDGEFQKIDQLFRKVLSPTTLNSHGYWRSLRNMNKNILVESLSQSISWFEENGYKIFMASGTLLGSIREGDFIDHDDDLDFGILIDGKNLTEVIEEMEKLEIKLKDFYGLEFQVFQGMELNYFWKIITQSGYKFDLFPAWTIDDRLYAYPYCNGKLNILDLLPIHKISMNKIKLPAPNKPERFLEINYGPNWKVPDPSWEFDWVNNSINEYQEFILKFRKKLKK